jgi:hypothetical protein
MNCSTGVRYEELSDDYTKKGYGAALTPLGQPAYCGCFPLNFEGEQVSDSPLRPTDFELTDVLGPAVDIVSVKAGGKPSVDPTTGTILPGKSGITAPKLSGGKSGTTAKAPIQLKTKPMAGQYKGEHLPGNPLWAGKTVKYLTDAERTSYKLHFIDGKIVDANGNLFDTSSGVSAHSGGGSAIFIMDGAGNFFASNTHAVGEFHHSSLASGNPVAAAGELRVEKGVLKGMTDKSGHYRPTTDMTDQAIEVLKSNGIDLSGVTKTVIGQPPPPSGQPPTP